MEGKTVLILTALAVGAFVLTKGAAIASQYVDPVENWDFGRNIRADYPTFTGGTFLNPGVLPPIRYARLQSKITGGKFVRPDLLPPEREVFIQKGSIGPSRRREDE